MNFLKICFELITGSFYRMPAYLFAAKSEFLRMLSVVMIFSVLISLPVVVYNWYDSYRYFQRIDGFLPNITVNDGRLSTDISEPVIKTNKIEAIVLDIRSELRPDDFPQMMGKILSETNVVFWYTNVSKPGKEREYRNTLVSDLFRDGAYSGNLFTYNFSKSAFQTSAVSLMTNSLLQLLIILLISFLLTFGATLVDRRHGERLNFTQLINLAQISAFPPTLICGPLVTVLLIGGVLPKGLNTMHISILFFTVFLGVFVNAYSRLRPELADVAVALRDREET